MTYNKLEHVEADSKALATISSYGLFDKLEFSIDAEGGNILTRYGQVLRPTIRKDAERRVSRIEGVARVNNNIRRCL